MSIKETIGVFIIFCWQCVRHEMMSVSFPRIYRWRYVTWAHANAYVLVFHVSDREPWNDSHQRDIYLETNWHINVVLKRNDDREIKPHNNQSEVLTGCKSRTDRIKKIISNEKWEMHRIFISPETWKCKLISFLPNINQCSLHTWNFMSECRCSGYQTSHFSHGFIGVPAAHWKSMANSLLFCTEPITRNRCGEWESLIIEYIATESLLTEHHSWAAEIQNICLDVYCLNPGKCCSSFVRFSHFV